MSSTWSRMRRTLGIIVPVSVTVLAASAGVAHAQFTLEGSDTLTDVMKDAIAASGANMVYSNLGSGQGEKDIATAGCPAAGITGANFREGIAPMSRNFQAKITTACPSFTPSATNVLGLDAAVFSSANFPGRCLNQQVPLASTTDPTIADPTNPSDLSILFFGYNTAGTGKGTTAECADPHRIAALNRLIGCMGVNDITHIYRRDDNSGTQDTIREHLKFNFWCNGKAEGRVTNPVGSNVLNEDLDPIRRACIAADATHAKTRCTYYPTAQTCSAGDPDITVTGYGTVKCTQGLVVALSENDPGSDDITVSIANRIKNDGFHQTLGMAGRASVELLGQPTAGMTINTVTFTNGNVRANQYMFSRRLFLQRNPAGSGDAGRDAVEGPFFTWSTTRCNMDPLVKNRGFLTCFDDCTLPCTDTGNLCCITPLSGSSIPKQNIGAETNGTFSDLGDGTHPCVQNGNMSTASTTCGPIPVEAATFACNLGAKCTGGTCAPDSSGLGGICQ
jgi:ABC-type phosphate transport system substrate-binding protein